MKIKVNEDTLVFYKKENDAKYSFCAENNEELTNYLLDSTKRHRISENGLQYSISSLAKLIRYWQKRPIETMEAKYNKMTHRLEMVQNYHDNKIKEYLKANS